MTPPSTPPGSLTTKAVMRFTVEFSSQDWTALPAQTQTRILDSARPGNPKSRLLRELLDAASLLERLWSS